MLLLDSLFSAPSPTPPLPNILTFLLWLEISSFIVEESEKEKEIGQERYSKCLK